MSEKKNENGYKGRFREIAAWFFTSMKFQKESLGKVEVDFGRLGTDFC